MITFNNVTFSYNDMILEDVNLSLKKNKFYSIIGDNGSGKSTLLKLMCNILKPTSGEIKFENSTFKDCGLIFQNPEDQFVSDTVINDLLFAMQNKNFSKEKMSNNLIQYSKIMGVNELLDSKIDTLSGGQKQRVAICSILCMEQKIILLDEATSMLDPMSKKKFLNYLNTIKGKYTIISISHDIEETLISDNFIYIYDKKVHLISKEDMYKIHKPYLFKINENTNKKYTSYEELMEDNDIRSR